MHWNYNTKIIYEADGKYLLLWIKWLYSNVVKIPITDDIIEGINETEKHRFDLNSKWI